MSVIRGFLLALVLAQPVAAQEQITPDQFLDRATGRTLTFVRVPDGSLVGVEQFLDRQRSLWARSDGSCSYGRVAVEGPELCFYYDDAPSVGHCWLPILDGETLFVALADGSEVQRISRITDTMVDCFDKPLS